MDVISYALSKKIAAHAVSGVQSMSVNGQTLTINTKDSGVLTMTFPTPKDGISVTDIDVNANNQIVFTMSDGSEFISGKIPTVKGEPGFSPTITENANNTDKIYKLDITTADSTFTTPNLKGADGQGGTGGDSSVTLTQEEYEALTEEEKLNGLYYIYDTKRIYKNGVQYGASEPIPLTMAEYEALKEAGAIDEQQEYLIEADDKGILIDAKDIGYNNAKSGIQATTVQDAIDKIAENSGSGEKNVQSDWNETDDTADGFIKNKPTIPEAYDDTALSNRVKAIEDDYAKSSDIPSLSGYATETWVNEQGFLTHHQDISNLVEKEDGKTLISTEDISQIAQNKTDIETLNGTGEGSIEKKIANKLSEQTYLTKEIATADEVAAYIADPTTAKFNVIYLVKDENATGADKYFEYQRIGNEESSSFQMTGDTSTDLSDYAKTANIPTTLPANGGNADTVNNHTVEADVPTDAKFTDTIYDDTKVQKRISDNGYGEVAGGKNLLNPNKFLKWVNQYTNGRYSNDEITISPVNVYLYNNFFKFSDTDIDVTLSIKSLTFENGSNPRVCLVNSAGTIIGTVTTDTPSASGLGCGIKIDFTDLPTSITIKELMIEEGSVATEYEPYFQSNKMLAEEKADKSETTVNRLNPKLQTTTKDGITCTNNGDGTYTLNGTAVSTTYFFVQGITYLAKKTTNKYYKLVGCPTGGTNKYDLRYEINSSTANGGGKDFGNGVIIKNDKINSTDITSAEIIIAVLKGVTVNNLVFKPMLTTNLDATYDNFVPYTGDGETLTADVAELNSNLSELVKIKKSIIGDGLNDLDGTIYFNDNKFPVYIRIVGDTKTNNSSYAYLSFEIGGRTFPVDGENAKHFTDQSFDETFAIPSGSYLAFLNQRNVTSNLEIYSANVTSNVINNVNESLDEQGLLNVGNDFVKGIVTWDGNVDFNDALGVVSKNPKPCKAGDVITVKTDKVYDYLYIATWKENTFFDRPSFSGANKEITYIIPDGVTSFRVMIANSSGTINYANDCMVYINNEIEKLKNDLNKLGSKIEFGNVDFNSLTSSMVYAINGTCTNAPKTDLTHGVLMVFIASDGIISQLYHDSDGTLYKRMCWGGTWSNWS